ncbi:FimD/PapC C-terminal domain-containing protein, partial [Escherichia coli]|uniref:FimD/PapC C-terminal domain-containing protein n=1 Tax=Escherichia coli TaxID=562 RepID=UPI0038624A3E
DRNRSHWSTSKTPSYTKSVSWQHHLRPDGSPLTFGYDVLDLQENNIGVVGQGSRLFIRVDEIPTGIKVALNDEQNLFCTITFQHVIDENKTYICQ